MSHPIMGRGQYSPSGFLDVPPPPPPPRTSGTPPPPPPPHTYPSNVQQLLKRMSPCQPGASGAAAHARGTSPVSRQPMVVQNSPQVYVFLYLSLRTFLFRSIRMNLFPVGFQVHKFLENLIFCKLFSINYFLEQ